MRHEIVYGSEGMTFVIFTNVFDGKEGVEVAGSTVKKIKAKSAQVEETIKEIRKEAIMSTQAPVNTIEQMMRPAPQINEIPKVTMVPQEEEKQEEKVEEVKPNMEPHRYSFEIEEPVNNTSSNTNISNNMTSNINNVTNEMSKEEKREPYSQTFNSITAALYGEKAKDSRYDYDRLYEKMDPLEKLKEAFKKTEAGTYAYTVYKQGISKVEEFDVQIEENDREHVDLEQKLREIQEKMTANEAKKEIILSKKKESADVVANAAKQAAQLDAYAKAMKEAEIRREQERVEREAKEKAEEEASKTKYAEMLARIPKELRGEPEAAKKPTSVENIFAKFRETEDEVSSFTR